MSSRCPHNQKIFCTNDYRTEKFYQQVAQMRQTGKVEYLCVWQSGSACRVLPEQCEKLLNAEKQKVR